MPWTYYGVTVHLAGINASGIRWWAILDSGQSLRADTKNGMRELVRHYRNDRR